MGDVILFKRPKPSKKHKGNTLCRSNFHRWEIVQSQHFDVKAGKLVTVSRCKRCGKMKNEAL